MVTFPPACTVAYLTVFESEESTIDCCALRPATFTPSADALDSRPGACTDLNAPAGESAISLISSLLSVSRMFVPRDWTSIVVGP